jgi:hypothetical protein
MGEAIWRILMTKLTLSSISGMVLEAKKGLCGWPQWRSTDNQISAVQVPIVAMT